MKQLERERESEAKAQKATKSKSNLNLLYSPLSEYRLTVRSLSREKLNQKQQAGIPTDRCRACS